MPSESVGQETLENSRKESGMEDAGTRTPASGSADKTTLLKMKFPPGKKEEMKNAVMERLIHHVSTGNHTEAEKEQGMLAWLEICE